MKYIICLLLLVIFAERSLAQNIKGKKPATIGLHFFYNDFSSAEKIQTLGFSIVAKNNRWTRPGKMQGGFGLDYIMGITKKIDAVGTLNASWVDYLLPGNVFFGTNNFLLDVNAGVHFKMFSDRRTINPFLITKVGYNSYKSLEGVSLQPGVGVQFSLFREALILATTEYRNVFGNTLSNQLYYSIGIATNIGKLKPKIAKLPVPTEEKKEPLSEEKLIKCTIVVSVVDEATSLPLKYVLVKMTDTDGETDEMISDENGRVIFTSMEANQYKISGSLNEINTTTATISKSDFNDSESKIDVKILHNDPRFTLVGYAMNLTTNQPVGNTTVTLTNLTKENSSTTTSNEVTGEFHLPLEAGSDFHVVGKKSKFISNIEALSTKGISRSTTLYVNLQLGIEAAGAGDKIILKNIYFETGKSTMNGASSTDLNKLVQFLKDNLQTKLEIQGHTDNVGNVATNVKLSEARAVTVVNYLIAEGIRKDRLSAKGFGPAVPIAENNSAEGKAKNRRVEIKILE